MQKTVEDKLDRIWCIWNNFILEHRFCSSKIKFNEDVKTNYLGDIFGYFKDTLSVVFKDNKHSNYTDKFSFTISFLQAIYIQQDFTQEMLEIFRIDIDKGKLKKDPKYSINRDLRNELIGHPLRKIEISTKEFVEKECDSCGKLLNKPKNKLALLSSTLFSYAESEDEIQYLLYHRNNNFKFESKTFKISDIQERHQQFLLTYFDIILLKLKSILEKYLLEIDKLEKLIDNHDFKTVLKFVEIHFEYIFKSDYVYDKVSLIKIYDRKDEHIRYRNFIDRFNNDLRTALADKRKLVKDIFERKESNISFDTDNSFDIFSMPDIEDPFFFNEKLVEESGKVTYSHEISMLKEKRNLSDFDSFGGKLKRKCQNNETVLKELEHMERKINDEIEYHTSLRLICLELNEK